jgi:quinol monooxygenase YgiN
MFSRIVDCNIQNGKLSEFKNTLNSRFIPRVKAQPGFVDLVESVDPATGHFVCMTLWKTQQDLDRYNSSLFQEIAQTLGPLMNEPPKVHSMQVENSTAHKIGAAA